MLPRGLNEYLGLFQNKGECFKWYQDVGKFKTWVILRICNQMCSELKIMIYFFTKSFFVDLVILDTFHNCNILLKSIFTHQEIDKQFDDVKTFVDFLTSKYLFQKYVPIMNGV